MNADELLSYLATRLSRTTGPDDIAELMEPYAAASAWIHLGGSGARQQIFRADASLRALFAFDGGDQLIGYAVYETTDPDLIPPSPEVRLVLL